MTDKWKLGEIDCDKIPIVIFRFPLNLLSSVKDVTCSLKNILKFSGGIADSFARLLLPA